MQQMSSKILSIQTKQKENEEKTATELHEIQTEMRNNQETLQETITANVISQINPIVNEKQNSITANDVQRIVEEAISKLNQNEGQEAVEKEDTEEEPEGGN